MVPGLAGVAVSHEPPEDVATAALKVTPAVPVTLMDCVDGAVAQGQRWARRAQKAAGHAREQIEAATDVGQRAFDEAARRV